MKQIVYPCRIVASSVPCENLLKRQDRQIGLNESCLTEFSKGAFVVLDFGKELCGGVRILNFSGKAKIRIRFGESVSECYAELGGTKNATNDHALRDFETEILYYSDMTFGSTGYRFVRLDLIEGTAKIKSVLAVNQILSKKAKWAYHGRDERIKTIYEAAKRTIDLCTGGEYVWDGVKRDRLVWVGDMHPEMLAITSLYGGLKSFENSLDFVRKQTPLPRWMNGYPSYSMWWIIILSDYLKRTNRVAFCRRQIPYMQGLIALMDEYVLPDGTLQYPRNFVDWPTSGSRDEVQGVRAINVLAMKKAVSFLEYFSEDTIKAKEVLEKLLKQPVVVERQKQVLGLKYFAVGLDEDEKKKLVEGGAKGLSTFMSYYILKAVASFDREKAIEMMKEYYGGMLDRGATTFWEDFDVEWLQGSGDIVSLPSEGLKDIHGDFGGYCYKGFRHSLCHGWSAGVLAFIEEECNY